MCYTCSSSCDHCRPKMMKCPSCHKVTLLARNHCAYCNAPIEKKAKEKARADWEKGVRFGNATSVTTPTKTLSRTNSPFVK